MMQEVAHPSTHQPLHRHAGEHVLPAILMFQGLNPTTRNPKIKRFVGWKRSHNPSPPSPCVETSVNVWSEFSGFWASICKLMNSKNIRTMVASSAQHPPGRASQCRRTRPAAAGAGRWRAPAPGAPAGCRGAPPRAAGPPRCRPAPGSYAARGSLGKVLKGNEKSRHSRDPKQRERGLQVRCHSRDYKQRERGL